jgi:hypothetical protein
VFQAKLLQRPGLREAQGIPSLSKAANLQGVGPNLRWGEVEFVSEAKGKEMASKVEAKIETKKRQG